MLLKRKYLFGTTILAGVIAASASAPAFAQTATAASGPKPRQVEEVVVTGSRIRRDPTNAPTPLIQVSREQLLNTGLADRHRLSGHHPGPVELAGSVRHHGLGPERRRPVAANLRSLGAGRTLTLVDGRRHVGSQGGSLSVDVDTIPRLLIENIEIVTGGASSVYGADAVSGVLNFVLRKDFEGLEIDATGAQINQDGPTSAAISALIGKNFFDDRLNVYAFGEYEKTEESQRWTSTGCARSVVCRPRRRPDLAATPYDGILDSRLSSTRRAPGQRPRWGSDHPGQQPAAQPP